MINLFGRTPKLFTWRTLMADWRAELEAHGVEDAARDVRLLTADALGVDAAGLIVIENDVPTPPQVSAALALIERRASREPVSRIRGWRDFHGHRFMLSPSTLDPRPDTETLVDEALKRIAPNARVLDLGTGSGCILLSVLAERSDARGVGVDLSPHVMPTVRANAEALGLLDRVQLIEGGWEAGLAAAPFDLVLSNPPYIPTSVISTLEPEVEEFEPRLALDGGPDGLAPYREILALVDRLLAPGGWIGFEFGEGQAEAVQQLMTKAGLEAISVHSDLGGRPRTAFGQRAE